MANTPPQTPLSRVHVNQLELDSSGQAQAVLFVVEYSDTRAVATILLRPVQFLPATPEMFRYELERLAEALQDAAQFASIDILVPSGTAVSTTLVKHDVGNGHMSFLPARFHRRRPRCAISALTRVQSSSAGPPTQHAGGRNAEDRR
jgi:hypothetical protein